MAAPFQSNAGDSRDPLNEDDGTHAMSLRINVLIQSGPVDEQHQGFNDLFPAQHADCEQNKITTKRAKAERIRELIALMDQAIRSFSNGRTKS